MSKKPERIRRQLEAYAQMSERCAVCWFPRYVKAWGREASLHHICGRRGGMDAHDHRNILCVCQRCHSDYHDGHSQRPLTLGHMLEAKRQEDGDEMLDLRFLAKLLGRVGLKEDPKPLPEWVLLERARNVRLLNAREPFIERNDPDGE